MKQLKAILGIALLLAVLMVCAHANLIQMAGTTVGPPAVIARVNTAIPTLTTNANPQFTYSYQTAANTNEMLVVGIWISPTISSDSQVSATYNGLPCSDSGATEDNLNGQDAIILEFCPLGTTDSLVHNLVVTVAFSVSFAPHVRVNEYSGVKQTLYLDGGAGANGTSPLTTTFSTTTTGAWLVGLSQTRNGAITVGGAMTALSTDFGGTDGNVQYADSNGTVSPGSHSTTWTQSLNMAALGLGLVPSTSTGGVYPPCATNFAFDWSMFAGCNAISAVIR